MNRAVQEAYEQASRLDSEERAELAALLLESIEDTSRADAGMEESWAAEIEHRMAEYRAGRMGTLSWQDLRAKLHRADR